MNLRSSEDKITFIVDSLCTIGFEFKGGSIAIHRLSYELAKLGHFVYMFNEPIYPHENIKVIKTKRIPQDDGWWSIFEWEGFNYDINKTVTIYSNLTKQNFFGTKNNVRWFLSNVEDDFSYFSPEDVICNFGSFKTPKGKYELPLTSFDYNLDKFKNQNLLERKGFGFILHKFTPDWGHEFLQKFDAKEIKHHNGQLPIDYLNEEFNKYEYVLTFDDKSYYTVIAALCGAKSIILNPKKDLDPSQYRKENPIQMYGVSYGMNDIKWANDTLHLVRDHIKELETKDQNTIIQLVNFWKKIMNLN